MFKKAKWIWNDQATGEDAYSEFLVKREFRKGDSVRMRISVDSNYAVYVNGVFANSGQYADMPNYKVFDEIDLSEHIIDGVNHIAIVAWYYGVACFTYYIGKPGVLFEIVRNDAVEVSSDASILSRKSRRYISGKKEFITVQLGLNYHVDLKESDAWMIGEDADGFAASFVQTDMPEKLFPRIAKKLDVLPLVEGEIVMQGSFAHSTDPYLTRHAGDRMQNSALSFFRLAQMRIQEEKPAKQDTFEDMQLSFEQPICVKGPVTMLRKTGDGIFFILDMKEETTGYLEFDLDVPEDCLLEVGWGEHLVDGRCRSAVGGRNAEGATARNFSVTALLKAGRNRYMNPMRRLGCRYIQFFVHAPQVRFIAAGLRPTLYPVQIKEFKTGNLLRDTIYEVSVHTLRQCMHEHYEDCTWREQSFYTGDSRNQMWAGYYAFEEYTLPAASLRLIANCVREDDAMQPICFPSNYRLTIPGGIPMYATQLAEYYRYSGDKETIEYCFDAIKRSMDAFASRIDHTGLLPNFDEKKDFWNFYEWMPYLDASRYKGVENYDMCLNGSFSSHLRSFIELCRVVGADETPYVEIRENLNRHIAEAFYDKEARLFRTAIVPGMDNIPFSALANVHAWQCGAAEGLDTTRIIEIIRDNGSKDPDIQVIPTTLYNTFERFTTLMQIDKELYRDTILDQIDRMCLEMLREGATTFWETMKGQADFDYAGSLCHGWGAMPIVFYHELLK